MSTLADFRRQYPQYDDMSDVELAEALHRKYYSDLPKEQVFKRLGITPKDATTDAAALLQQRGTLPAPTSAPKEEESTLSALGKAFLRYDPRASAATIIEDAPRALASAFAELNPAIGTIGGKALRDLGKIAARSSGYRDVTAKPAAELRAQAEERLAELGPRKFEGVFEEKGFGRKLGSLAETVAESALPTVAGIGTGLVTRSPVAAGAVMTAGIAPVTYGGIRERQQAEGIDDVRRAMVGTAVSSALDVMTGVGGKVLSSTASLAAKEALEGGIRQAIGRVLQTSRREAGTEMLQTVIEQVAGGSDPTTKEAMLEILEGGLAGALGGAVFSGATEGVTAPFRPRGGAATGASFVDSPAVEQEYLRLVAAEVQAVRDQNPGMTQRQAYDQVIKDAGKLYDTAIANTLLGAEEGRVDVPAEADTGVDVVGGGIASAAPDIGAAPSVSGAAIAGETVGGGLGRSIPSVPVSDVGAGAGVSTLTSETAQFDPVLAPVYDAPNIPERKKAAKPIINAIIDAVAGDVVVPAKVVNQAATQMAQRAARNEVFNPADVVRDVLTANGIAVAPEVASQADITSALPAAPSVDEAAVAPVKAAIEAVTATEPPVPGAVPTIAQAAAREMGIAQTQEQLPQGQLFQPVPTEAAPTAIEEELAARDQEVSQELLTPEEQVEPTIADTATVEGITPEVAPEAEIAPEGVVPEMAAPEATPEAAFTPQQVVDDLDTFAVTEAESRGVDPELFRIAADDVKNGREPIPAEQITAERGPEAAAAYDAGRQWAQDRIAEAQTAPIEAAPTPEAAAPPGAPPTPPTPPTATGGPSGPAPKKPSVVSNGKPVVLTEAQTRTALTKAKAQREKANRIQRRIAATNDTADVLSGGVELAKLVRGDKENLALLRGVVDTLDVGKWRVILPTLATEDIFRVLKGRIPGLTEADRIIRKEVTRFQSNEYRQLASELEKVAAFLKKHPKATQALSDLEFATTSYQVDPTKAATAEEYFAKVDNKAKELRAQLKTTKDLKKQGQINRALERRFKEIESVYKGVPGDERVLGWYDLARPEFGSNKGKEIFKLIRDAHRRDLEAKYSALRSRLMETKEGEALDEALEKLEAAFKPALDQVIYFPAMRFGSFYARIGEGANSIFKMFDTETQRNQFMRVMEARDEEITDFGNVEDLRNNFQQVTGGPLKEVLDLFDDNPKDIGALKSQVFDLWLQTMSQGDMRKHMAPRKARAGYSTDILKNFANFRRSSINDTKRAQYGYKLRTEISRAKDSVKDQPERAKMEEFIKEVELRTFSDLMPHDPGHPVWEAMIRLGNKAAFYQYLANPKTAAVQLTQLHIVVFPMLAQKYGHAKAGATLAKYSFSGLGGFVASPLKAVKSEDGSFTFDWEQPNLLDNPVSALKQTSDPDLYDVLSEGWNEGRDLNLFFDTFANQIGGYGAADPQQRNALQELMRGRVDTAAKRGATFALDAMGALMHQMERINREATYMAALELAYRENRKNGQNHAEAKKNAIESAVETTLEATFDFSSYNKPRIINAGVGRLAGQFQSYPWFLSSLLARNTYKAIFGGKDLSPRERIAAAEVATGTLFNIMLYAGIKGIPLYGFGMGLASMLLWAYENFADDDEEGGLSYIDENGDIKYTYNTDWWFRNVWLPKFLGPDGTVANLLGLDDDTAATVALAADRGAIPAITDVDISNSIALEFMFFLPKESRADTLGGKIAEYAVTAFGGAFGNTVMDYAKAAEDLMNGYTNRALERMPKLFGNVAKANRFAEEGQLNYNRELVGMDKDFWTNDKVILQALSFSSTEASQRQEQNYEARAIRADIEKSRRDLLDKFRKVALDQYQYGPTSEVLEERQKVLEEWVRFNQKYPTDVIGFDTLYEVETNAIYKALESKASRGVPFDMEKTPYLHRMLRERVEAEKR